MTSTIANRRRFRAPSPASSAARVPSCSIDAHHRGPPGSARRIVGAKSKQKARAFAVVSAARGDDDRRRPLAPSSSPSSTPSPPSSSPADDASDADDERRERLGRVLASTASSTTSAGEAHRLLTEAGLFPSLPSGDAPSSAAASALVDAALAAGNAPLALDVFRAMVAPPLPLGGLLRGGVSAAAPPQRWPRPTPAVAASLAVAMARSLRPSDAEAVLEAVRGRGPLVASSSSDPATSSSSLGGAGSEVPFGFVVPSPAPALALGAAAVLSSSDSSGSDRPPLAVVQPHEGRRTVACPTCRYELELFSGTVSRASSSPASRPSLGLLSAAASALFNRGKPRALAVHELDVITPGGVSRPFRFGTADADAPASVGQRVTVVCSPSGPSSSPSAVDPSLPSSPPRAVAAWRRGILSPSPPGTTPGQPLLVSNHATGNSVDALEPPPADSPSSPFPSWAGPLVLLAVAGDAASALADPSLPLAIAAAAAGAAAAGAATRDVALPSLRRLPESSLAVESSRSELLAQHVALSKASEEAARRAKEDARALARLWALRAKMGAVSASTRAAAAATSSSSDDDGGAGSDSGNADGTFYPDGDEYAERGGRVEAAAVALERRLSKAVELLDGYARVAARIEIEVELESEVPAAEAASIATELDRLRSMLGEAEAAAAAGAAAADEVERLLRMP